MDIILALGSIGVRVSMRTPDASVRFACSSIDSVAPMPSQAGCLAAGLLTRYLVDEREHSHPSALLGWVILSASFVPWALLPVDVYTYASRAMH